MLFMLSLAAGTLRGQYKNATCPMRWSSSRARSWKAAHQKACDGFGLGDKQCWTQGRVQMTKVTEMSRMNAGIYSPYMDIEAGARADVRSKFANIPPGLGLDFKLERARRILENVRGPFSLCSKSVELCKQNGQYSRVDSSVLYAFLRTLQPRRVLEVGSGRSTRVAAKALALNQRARPSRNITHTCIEPFRADTLAALNVHVIESRVQTAPLHLVDELQAGDVLFIDNSHVVTPYGDVVYEILFMLPRVQPGVVVHFHDIYLPHDYPLKMMQLNTQFTEQWLLAAFLANSEAWEILFPTSAMLKSGFVDPLAYEQGTRAKEPRAAGASFWICRKPCDVALSKLLI